MSLLDSLLRDEGGVEAPDAQRLSARAQLRRHGLPAARDEAWRYSSLRTLASKSFVLHDEAASTRALPARMQSRIAAATHRLVFVNGVLRSDLSTLQALPRGVRIDATLPTLQRSAEFSPADAFVAANQALASAGAAIEVAADTKWAAPLHVFYVGLTTQTPTMLHTRLRVRLAERAEGVLIEEHLGDADSALLCNRVLEVQLDADARLTHMRSIDGAANANSIHTSGYRLEKGAMVETFELTPGQALNRHQLDVELLGDGARFVSGGVQALSGRAHSDVQLSVHHRARNTSCDLIWRGIADQRARLGFTGNLHVDIGADGADAKLSSKNLLLSPHAEINTRPVLVIHADEVKAAHGATVGRLDERALFYLRSRGIPLARARVMLTHAFAIEALQALSDESLRAQMSAALRTLMAEFVGADDAER